MGDEVEVKQEPAAYDPAKSAAKAAKQAAATAAVGVAVAVLSALVDPQAVLRFFGNEPWAPLAAVAIAGAAKFGLDWLKYKDTGKDEKPAE